MLSTLARRLDALGSTPVRALGVLAGVMVAAGLGYSLHLGSSLRFWDEREYWDLAQGLVSRHEFGALGARAFRPPGYPTFLAAFAAPGLPVWTARLANFVLLAGTMVLLYRIVSRAAGPGGGIVAAAWVFAYPVLLYTAGTLYAQTLAGFLLCAAIEAVTDESSEAAAARAGVAYGLLILTVPTFAPLLAVVLVWMVWRGRRSALARAAIVAGLAALPVLAWSARNTAVLGRPVFVSTNSGLNLLLGNSPNTTAGSGVNVDLSYLPVPEGLDEVELSQFYGAAARRWIGEHPQEAVFLYFAKLANYFAVSERLATAGEGSAAKTWVLGLTYAPLLLVLAARLVSLGGFRWTRLEALLVLLYLANGLLAAAFFTRVRFRLPFDLLLIALLGLYAGRILAPPRPAPAPGAPSS